MKKEPVWILVFLLSLSFACAFGILPAKQTVETDLITTQINGQFSVINTQNVNLTFRVYAIGPLADRLLFSQEQYSLSDTQESIDVPFIVTLDEQAPPGEQTTKIFVEELPSQEGLASRVRLFHLLTVFSPKEGKHVAVIIQIEEGPETYTIQSTVRNAGRQPISEAKAIYQIKEQGSTKLSLRTPLEPIPVSGAITFSTPFNKQSLTKGDYNLQTIIDYDEKNTVVQTPVTLGTPFFSFLDTTNKITQEISAIRFAIRSDWNTLQQVPITLNIKDGSTILTKSTTPPMDIHPGRINYLSGFLDASNIPPGEYQLEIGLADQHHTFPLHVTEPTNFEISEASTTVFLTLLILVLIIGSIISIQKLTRRLR